MHFPSPAAELQGPCSSIVLVVLEHVRGRGGPCLSKRSDVAGLRKDVATSIISGHSRRGILSICVRPCSHMSHDTDILCFLADPSEKVCWCPWCRTLSSHL